MCSDGSLAGCRADMDDSRVIPKESRAIEAGCHIP